MATVYLIYPHKSAIVQSKNIENMLGKYGVPAVHLDKIAAGLNPNASAFNKQASLLIREYQGKNTKMKLHIIQPALIELEKGGDHSVMLIANPSDSGKAEIFKNKLAEHMSGNDDIKFSGNGFRIAKSEPLSCFFNSLIGEIKGAGFPQGMQASLENSIRSMNVSSPYKSVPDIGLLEAIEMKTNACFTNSMDMQLKFLSILGRWVENAQLQAPHFIKIDGVPLPAYTILFKTTGKGKACKSDVFEFSIAEAISTLHASSQAFDSIH